MARRNALRRRALVRRIVARALRIFAETDEYLLPVPISSINWHVNIVQPNAVAAEGGWWLLHQRAEAAADGYVSQDMTVYGGEDNGTLVAAGRQSVAIYA